jgi:dihydrofolate reductase
MEEGRKGEKGGREQKRERWEGRLKVQLQPGMVLWREREREREREKGLVKWFNSKQEALSSNRSMSTWLVGGAKFYVMCGFNSS